MKTAIVTVCLLVSLPLAAAPIVSSLPPPPPPPPSCVAAQTGAGSFDIITCGVVADWTVTRNPASATVVWTVTTDLGSTSCVWPANDSASCNGDPPPTTPLTVATYTVSVSGGAVTFIGHSP